MKSSTLRSLRQWHHYIGVFLAPAILFFAFSGLIQVVGWQDQRDPAPPAWVSAIAAIHKHQAMPKPRPATPTPDAAGGKRPGKGGGDHDHGGFVPLKIFALLTALGLLGSTLVGLTIAFANRTTRRVSTIALILGIVLPCGLMLL